MFNLKSRFDEQGYVVVPDLISPHLLQPLKEACDCVIVKTRSGEWQHRRIVGKQFPPFIDTEGEPDSWGVQHLMHPALGEPVFAEWYGSDALRSVCQELMACEEGDLQLELFNLLINPERHKFALRWHRDDLPPTATEDQERQYLAVQAYGVQWNTALYPDSCLYIVPKTHNRPRTDIQRAQSSSLKPPADPLHMPGAIQVQLAPGETVFYDNNILHCATYDPSQVRATLHACMGDARGGGKRARNILQHDLRWMRSETFADTLPKEGPTRGMWRKLIDMAGQADGKELGYSQAD
ncbi:hypothetical protein FRB96_006834 [Tulasnella sp. 330]|nr:hypothetical protein FRB96_006834 [Tulasnella sp. 330]KAG8872990.1 hypothetical protein FRB97_007137 [Tulasnella sp. 331]KAG8876611.1 hypothetical protein FRB98_007113 [Tulasnella sp. 332]